jgi:lysozyme
MKISQQGIDLIKSFEGCKLKPYLCPAKKWTVGWGHVLGNGVTLAEADNRIFTQGEADVLLRYDLRRFESGVCRLCAVPLIQHQHIFDAVVAWSFNLGLGCLQRSTMRQKILRQDGEAASKELLKYDKVNGKPLKGLTRRRQAEYRLFTQLDPITDTSTSDT